MIFELIGILLLIGFAVLDAFVRWRMKRIGHKWVFIRGGTFDYGEYLKVRIEHGWSAWPIYLLWGMLIMGLVFVSLGIGIRYGFHPPQM
jgi:hypothetical protein